MNRFFRILFAAAVLSAAACAPRERTIILLSTNDMHAKIQRFAQLATAVEQCRDTAQLVVLVDAGDRWTGNAFVDRAPTPGMPIIRLMNKLGYDVATLGNHEFDHGQAFLGRMLDSMDFEVVCANVISDTCTFPQLPPYTIVKRGGVRIGFVGVVTNYEGPGHPAGNEGSFAGLEFPDPQQMAARYGKELREKCDILVLVSHMGDDRDEEFLLKNTSYDEVIGGHTHKEINKLVDSTLLTQTGKDLYKVGVTVIRMKGDRITDIDYRLVSLKDYAPDPEFQRLVDESYANPELRKPIGSLSQEADKWGLANWMAEMVADQTDADVGFYHIGGVRLDSMQAEGVSTAQVFDLEPFGTQIGEFEMTPEAMSEMVLSKYNDTINKKESHRIDLISTTPYTIVTDGKDAVKVTFPDLKPGKTYKVAVSDYIYNNYKNLNFVEGSNRIVDVNVADLLLEELEDDSPVEIDNTPRQQVVIQN